MGSPSEMTRVVYRPVEPGSDLEVPFLCMSGSREFNPDNPIVVWAMGWGEGGESAGALSATISSETGFQTYSVRPPLAQIVKKATNLGRSLDDFVKNGLADVAKEVAHGEVFYAGNSLGGPPAIAAAAENDCLGLVTISPAGLHNKNLGPGIVARAARLGSKLLVVTTAQNVARGDLTVRHVLRGGKADMRDMGLRLFSEALGYVVSDHLQDMTEENLARVKEKGTPAAIIAPCEDACFSDVVYRRVLRAMDCEYMLLEAKGPHATMEGSCGQGQKKRAAQWISSVATQSGLSPHNC